MQKQTSIYIPKPCHEDWNKMTPIQQGKFCSACNKQVVDFSLMSDNQILSFLSHQQGKLCGRFDAEQLQRPLVETKIKKKNSWWMALTMPLLFLFERSEAQDNKVIGDTTYNVSSINETGKLLKNKMPVCEPVKELTGTVGLVSIQSLRKITIQGKVVDEKNNPVPYATIMQKGTKNGVAADMDGKFSLKVDAIKSVTITVSAVGVNTVEEKIESAHFNDSTLIIVHTSNALSGDVVVVGYAICHKPIRKIDSVTTAVKNVFKVSAFKIYPNPVDENEFINIQIKDAGNYQMQLLDNQSRLIQAEEINVEIMNSTTQIQLQSNIAAGIYYLRLINEQTKKSYTEKLIIQ